MAENSFYSDPDQIISRTANGALAEGEIVVTSTTNENCARAGADALNILGVARTAAVNGAGCDIVMGGIARVLAGGAIARGAMVVSNAAGRAIAATAAVFVAPGTVPAHTPTVILGMAMEAAGVDGEFVAVKIRPAHMLRA